MEYFSPYWIIKRGSFEFTFNIRINLVTFSLYMIYIGHTIAATYTIGIECHRIIFYYFRKTIVISHTTSEQNITDSNQQHLPAKTSLHVYSPKHDTSAIKPWSLIILTCAPLYFFRHYNNSFPRSRSIRKAGINRAKNPIQPSHPITYLALGYFENKA